MAKVRVELNKNSIGALLKSEDLKEKLDALAKKHAGGWQTDTKMMGTRVIASIYSTDQDQIADELNDHALVRRIS